MSDIVSCTLFVKCIIVSKVVYVLLIIFIIFAKVVYVLLVDCIIIVDYTYVVGQLILVMQRHLHLITCDLQVSCPIYMIPYTTMGDNIILHLVAIKIQPNLWIKPKWIFQYCIQSQILDRILDSNSLDIFQEITLDMQINYILLEMTMDHQKCSCMSITFFSIEY